MFSFTVDTEGFKGWIFSLHSKFENMLRTMIDIHHLIQANTNWRVPLDTGRLEESFRYDIVRMDDFFIEMHSIYSAVDPDSGFDYAEYQHNEIETWRHYRKTNRRGEARGEQFYLLHGVQASESMMFTLIEQDYLSLFYGGL